MIGFYESYTELARKKRYTVGFETERESMDGESQFLNSLPEEAPLIGMIPMTGEGIDADIDDLFCVSM